MATKLQDSIVLFGDSITQEPMAYGLGHRMTATYSRRLDVLNRGYGGYNTEWIRPVFDQIFLPTKDQSPLPTVKLITIWFGANDACLPTKSQHVPLSKYTSNLSHFITSLLSPSSTRYHPSAKVILITPGPIIPSVRAEDAIRAGKDHLGPDREVDVTRSYKDACKKLGEDLKKEDWAKGKLEVVDFWGKVVEVAGGEGDKLLPYFSDGLHLTQEGYQIIYDQIMSVIKSQWPDLDPDAKGDPLRNVPPWDTLGLTGWKETLRKTLKQPYPTEEL